MSLKGNPQTLSPSEALERYASNITGLTQAEATERLARYGPNSLREEKPSHLKLFLRQFKSILVYILIAAAILTLLIGDFKDTIIIVGLILFNSLIGFWQELKAEASIQALKKLTETRTKVLRDGKEVEVPSTDLVPGDVILLSEGDLVSADARLLESSGLMIDESSITGESVPVSKQVEILLPEKAMPYELTNCLISGTVVTRGSGKALVTATGSDTYIAGLAEKAQEASPESPLTKALAIFSRRYVILILVLITSLGVLAIAQGRDLVDVVYLLVAQLVSAVPEGLPLVITLVTVIGAMALSKRKTLTRYLPAVETLGSATVIASDKTGTITEGRLTVAGSFILDEPLLRLCGALCNDAKNGKGDSVDVAIANWFGESYEEERIRNPRIWSHPFDADLRMMATCNETTEGKKLFVKGAYESLKAIATNQADFAALEKELDSLAEKGLRVLAFGVGEGDEEPSSWKVRIVGLLGFLDPPKEGVREAVLTAKKAGMRVIMITGDHPKTALAIARSVGIWSEGDGMLTGKELEGLDDSQLCARLQNVTVLARVIPEHKYRVVKVLQSCGEIVAVTGDGVNDVPALRAADLGVAMGSGTEAAKSAAKMIITDNNLNVIVEAIRMGRIIADNIRKVIYYLLSTNINQIVLIALSLMANLPLPLIAIQILWINLVTDGVQDKTFPFAKEEGDVMARMPRDPQHQFFDREQIFRILFFALAVGWLIFEMYELLLTRYSRELAITIVFTSLVVAQWVNGIQAQKEKEPFFVNVRRSFTINPYVYMGVGVGMVLQLAAVYLLNDWFYTVPMNLEHWLYVLMIAVTSFVAIEARKLVEYYLMRKPQDRNGPMP
ncbi:MAG: cation-transporting P-type ATPase [Methanomassiliicoccales archaeon]